MKRPYPITNQTVKTLRYIHRHELCSFRELKAKFPKLDYMELVNLCLDGYLTCQKPGRLPTVFADGDFSEGADDIFWPSPRTTEFLENRLRGWLQWVIPVSISSIALIVSIVSAAI